MTARVRDRQMPIEYRYKVILAARRGDRSRSSPPPNNPDKNFSVSAVRNRPPRLKMRDLAGCRRNFALLVTGITPFAQLSSRELIPSITKCDRTYHLLGSTDITVSTSSIEQNESIQLNPALRCLLSPFSRVN